MFAAHNTDVARAIVEPAIRMGHMETEYLLSTPYEEARKGALPALSFHESPRAGHRLPPDCPCASTEERPTAHARE